MAERLEPGAVVDGFTVGECVHHGGTGYIYRVTPPPGHDPGFPVVMKVPPIGAGQPTLGIVSFEMELMILPALHGPHVPRFVAAGDLLATPYIAMEWIAGEPLADVVARAPLSVEDVARLGAALADAVHSVHQQHVVHLDLKPENFIVRPSGEAVLIDFGFAHHADYPDLLGEEKEFAAGSAAYVSPEQLNGTRGDPRSDIFALGALLYELATGEPPFGEPKTMAGMRDRLWRVPAPPRALNPTVTPWLQEIILHCLEPLGAGRYQSSAHVAFDLRHPEQVALTERAQSARGLSFFAQLRRWWGGRRSPLAKEVTALARAPGRAPVIMVAVDTEHMEDERHPSLQWTTRQIVSLQRDFRLMCVSVITAASLGVGNDGTDTATGKHLEHKARLRHWVEPLGVPPWRVSLHVVESGNSAETLLDLARVNNVDLIVLGAPGPSERALAWWRSVASSVTANAHCSVHVVRVPPRGRDAEESSVPTQVWS